MSIEEGYERLGLFYGGQVTSDRYSRQLLLIGVAFGLTPPTPGLYN